MMKKEVGIVTIDERDEIQAIFERKNGLTELAKILTPDNGELYERLVKDLSVTSSRFQNWWNSMADKYNWEMSKNGHWEINFDSRVIYLVTTE